MSTSPLVRIALGLDREAPHASKTDMISIEGVGAGETCHLRGWGCAKKDDVRKLVGDLVTARRFLLGDVVESCRSA